MEAKQHRHFNEEKKEKLIRAFKKHKLASEVTVHRFLSIAQKVMTTTSLHRFDHLKNVSDYEYDRFEYLIKEILQ